MFSEMRETADHVGVLGKTHFGAVFTADISGGAAPEDARFSFEIRGSEGWLSLTSDHPYGFQAGDLTLTSNISFATPDEPAISGGFMGAAINVGEIYAHLVRDLHVGTYNTPNFDHALHNARLIDAVRRAAERGERQKVTSLQVQIWNRSLLQMRAMVFDRHGEPDEELYDANEASFMWERDCANRQILLVADIFVG
jgi:predicted dehydrogenase